MSAHEVDLSDFTLDGSSLDWVGISGATLTLVQSVPFSTDVSIDVMVRIIVNESHMALLFQVHDRYHFNTTNEALTPHMAVMWAINDSASPHMGTNELGLSTGKVDFWHWTVHSPAGVMAGGKGTTPDGHDPDGGLDDEWATSPTTREDDADENSLIGTWNHTGINSGIGASGNFNFEIMRPLQTNDSDDTQFVIGKMYKFGLAYWSPDQTPLGSTESGHLTTSDLFGWIHVTIGEPETTSPSSPSGFSSLFPFILSLLVITVLTRPWWKKR